MEGILKDDAYAIFIMPPSVEELRKRLQGRNTETEEDLEKRLARAEMEIGLSSEFDKVVLNDDLDTAVSQVEEAIRQQMKKWNIKQ